MDIRKILQSEEGFRSQPYLCSNGYVTIGYGTKLHKRKGMNPKNFPLHISEAAATELLNQEVLSIRNSLLNSKHGKTFADLSRVRQDILVSMAYQLGVTGLLKFKKTWKNIELGLFTLAAMEMSDSKWARQDSPARANRHSLAMAHDNLNEYKIYF